ncbi:MAG: 5-methyltetrahydrofolate--homocysteine methyltransferase [Lachnospiraceae bacterium]|nr:5-methyltetrahydrofolate--homocysteine methyltransferase [Lachnospiraceae bacterium]
MTRQELYDLLEQRILLCDGATGSLLQKAGMPAGVCPEQWILEHPEAILKIQRDYVAAGSDIIYAPTFGCNRIKLKEYGLEEKVVSMNRELTALAKQAADGKAFVAGDMTMTGESLAPLGTLTLEELIDVYKEQAAALYEAGVDLFVVETMMSLPESRAAVIAIQETCDLPIMVTMTFAEDGKTLYGTTPEAAAVVLESLGASVIGVNCSTGPLEMTEVVKRMRAVSRIPILAKPNAGLPELEDGKTVYKMTADEFVFYIPNLVEAGAGMLGGCCGTDAEFIKKLKETVTSLCPPDWKEERLSYLASERIVQPIDPNGPFLLIGERMNPTGKKALQAELREGSRALLLAMAAEQEEKGAHILDLNVGMNGINEKETMLHAIEELGLITSLPLCIDTSHVDIMEAALRAYPGRALINSISMEQEKIEKALPLAARYGAMFIALPLSDAGLPETIDEKKALIHQIIDRAEALGIPRKNIIVDGLVATVGAQPDAALNTLETIRYCKEELGLATVTGLSNISFGLPERMKVNAAFLAMAMAKGLTMAIANPSSEKLMDSMYASALLQNKPGSDLAYIRYCQKLGEEKAKMPQLFAADQTNGKKTETVSGQAKQSVIGTSASNMTETAVYKAVLNGNRSGILKEVEKELVLGTLPGDIIDKQLIPAINKVGDLFDKQIYFLPQLISSAEAMKKAIEMLEPMMAAFAREAHAVIVIATVEGDIHDIGKNLVALMLRNYGFRVIDLGKNVPKEDIVKTALEEKADFIVLSALMTTTMMEMKEVIKYRDTNGCKARVLIGGAVITQSFADEIGADGYSKDAADAVRLVNSLLER